MDRQELEQNVLDVLGLYPNYLKFFRKSLSLKEFHLSRLQLDVLRSLNECDHMTLEQLCEQLDISEKKMTKAILDLLDQKLINMVGKKLKPRHSSLLINRHGQEYLECVQKMYRDSVFDMMRSLSDEELKTFADASVSLIRILNRVMEQGPATAEKLKAEKEKKKKE